jgi:hypothetical protein
MVELYLHSPHVFSDAKLLKHRDDLGAGIAQSVQLLAIGWTTEEVEFESR